ncbi:MAG: hypothetical protein JWR52_2127 [Marmoricola sp.]|nr:hypothetical protein [Marmoricola sp.]
MRFLTGRFLVGLMLTAAAAAVVGIGLTQVRTDTTTASFLPLNDPTQKATIEAARSFGGDPIVVLAESSKPAALLEGDQITKLVGLEGALSRLPDVAVVYGPGTVLNQVASSAQDMLATISGRRDGIQAAARIKAQAAGKSPAAVAAAVARSVQAFDVRYGALLVKGLPAGLPTLHNSRFVQSVVFDQDGQPRVQWRFVVPRPDAVAIVVRPRDQLDQAATERLVEATKAVVNGAGLHTTRITVTGMPVVAAGLGGLLRHEIPVVGACALALIGGCYLFLPWLSRKRHRLLPLAATLAATAVTLAAFGWLHHPVSLGVVAFLPILLGTGSDFPAYLVRGADRRRVIVTATAAAAGFATLGLSPVPFVRDLGLSLGAGVLLAIGFGLWASRLVDGSATAIRPRDDVRTTVSKPALGWAARAALLAVAAGISVTGWIALPHLRIEGQPERLAAGAPELTDAHHAQSVLGSAGEVDILVRGNNVITPASLAWMTDVQDLTLQDFGDQLHPVVSPPTLLAFLGPNPTAEQLQAGLNQLPPYLLSSVIRQDGKEAVLSFGIKLGDVGSQQTLLNDLRRAIPTPPRGLRVDLAGLPVVTARGYQLISSNRYVTGLVGIAAAGLVLLIGLRRKSDALRGILAAGLATGWGLSVALALGISLTPLTVALGSLATATACEFSVLLGGPHDARVRRSVLVAAAAATCGYLALTVSGLTVIQNFGLFLAATVLLSLVAAQVVRLLMPERAVAPEVAALPVDSREEVLV